MKKPSPTNTLRSALVVGALFTLSVGTGGQVLPAGSHRPIQTSAPSDWLLQILSNDLDYPWSIAGAGRRVLMAEKAGNVVVFDEGNLRRYPLQTSDPIASVGGAGLLGLALATDFAQSGVAYFYHSYQSPKGLANKVIEARFDGEHWRESRVLLTAIPGHALYNGGAVGIGPDQNLYVTTGWTANRRLPQDLASLAGKVLRMSLDGGVPDSNPFSGSLVYSYGHRNPQGMAWSPAGELFVAEHGEFGRDEINRITPGANYGWPLAQGAEQHVDLHPSWMDSGHVTWAPAGIAFAGSELLVAALGSRELLVLDNSARALKRIFSSGDRIRAVLPLGQDLYLITTNRSPRAEGPSRDRLLRITLRHRPVNHITTRN